jgi:hypothetical protein
MSSFSAFFESPAAFEANLFPRQIFDEIRIYLQENAIFKRNAMREILFSETNYSYAQWLEWFNWYYQAFAIVTPTWLTQKLIAYAKEKSCFSVVSYQDLFDAGWTVQDVVASSISLSAIGISNYYPDSNELEHWTRLRSKNLGLFTGIILAGELVAQVGFIMLNADEFQQLRNCEISEDKIRGLSSEYSGGIYLYIPSVVIKKAFQKRHLLPVLIQHLLRQLNANETLFKRVKGFIALAYTNAGEKLCEGFNLSFFPQLNSDKKVFIGTIADFNSSTIVKKLKLTQT